MERIREPDEQLMWRVAWGNREPLNTLIRRYASGLLTFIQRMIGDRHQSEELFQEVFLAVWTGRKKYEYPRPFRPWLFGIAVNKCRAAFRSASGEPASLDTEDAAALAACDSSPCEAVVASETATLVARAVAKLPPGQRTVVVLRIWNGLSYHEIAKIIGRSDETVRSQMFHGLKSLRKYLEPHMR